MKRKLFPVGIFLLTLVIGSLSAAMWIFNNAAAFLNVEPLPLPEINYAASKSFPGLSKDIHTLKKSQNQIFPENTFQNFKDKWYADQLHSMDERSIISYDYEFYEDGDYRIKDEESYRFLWIRSFHRPIFVKIQRSGKGISLTSKEMENVNQPRSGKFVRLEYKALSQEQWQEFLYLLEKAEYWKLPTREKYLPQDGAKWILEGVKKNRYHVIERTSPSEESFREACVYLLQLSGVDVDKLGNELY